MMFRTDLLSGSLYFRLQQIPARFQRSRDNVALLLHVNKRLQQLVDYYAGCAVFQHALLDVQFLQFTLVEVSRDWMASLNA